MDEKMEKAVRKVVVEALQEVVLPEFEKMNKRIDSLEGHVIKRDDDVFTKMDAVFKELVGIRQEVSGHQQQLDDHSERFEKIEAIPVIAHELKWFL